MRSKDATVFLVVVSVLASVVALGIRGCPHHPTCIPAPPCNYASAFDLEGRSPGDLLASVEVTPCNDPTFPDSARAWRVLYVSTLKDNNTLAAICGMIVAPSNPEKMVFTDAKSRSFGRAVAWSHGTWGLTNRCQPSNEPSMYIWGSVPFGINAISWEAMQFRICTRGCPRTVFSPPW